MKKLLMTLLILASTTIFSAERNEIKISSIDDASTVTVNDGCSITVKNKYWLFDGTEKVDCHGLILKKVVGVSNMGKEIELENVAIFPIMDIQDANNIIEAIKYEMNGDIPENITLELSSLRYYGKKLKLSDITSDEDDTANIVLGGIGLRFVSVQMLDENRKFTQRRNINAGIN